MQDSPYGRSWECCYKIVVNDIMHLSMDIRKEIQILLNKAVYEIYGLQDIEFSVDVIDEENFGDFTTNAAFVLSKSLHKSPPEIASAIVNVLSKDSANVEFEGKVYPILKKIEFKAPGFINFTLIDYLILVGASIGSPIVGVYKSENIKTKKRNKIVLEYSQPNTNKPQHVGHARNNFIGSSLAKILEYLGSDVIKVNYPGDIGIHICKSMLMYMKYGESKGPDKKGDHFVGDFYVMYEKEYEKNPEIEKEAQELLRRWEKKDPEVIELWRKMNDWVYEGWTKTYNDQKVEFDTWEYESDNIDIGKEMAHLALERGLAEKDSSGAIIAKLEKYNIPDKVLLRSDGTSVYSTKDLQLAKNSFEKYKFDKRLYVVDMRQQDYFRQLFKILDLLGFDWAGRLVHIPYGMVSLPEGKMSSRTGVVANADDVLGKLVELERKEISGSMKSPKNLEETAEKVALAAFRYGMLKIDPRQDLVFDINQVTKFEGNTGPYLLYTYARAGSVLSRSGVSQGSLSYDAINLSDNLTILPRERSLAFVLCIYELAIAKAGESYSPNHIANYCFDLAQKFNSFYAELPIIDAESEDAKMLRLYLTGATMRVLKLMLGLLGIEVVEKM